MPTSDEMGWAQFDRFVRSGVPHAMDIAIDLANSSLSVPTSPSFDTEVADLLFYGPIHFAHRRGVLARFLRVLEVLRGNEHWQFLRKCRSAQLTLIESVADTSLCEDREYIELLCAWMQVQDALARKTDLDHTFNKRFTTQHKRVA